MRGALSGKMANECRQLAAFKRAYCDFPAGTIKYSDKPDIIVEGRSKIGIEITEFDLVNGGDQNSERQQSLMRCGVVKKAQTLYLRDGKAVELTFAFDLITAFRM